MANGAYHIFGCGAIGSSVAIELTRLGATSMMLYDFDAIEEANLGVSIYTTQDIKQKKIIALSSHLRAISPTIQLELIDAVIDIKSTLKIKTTDIIVLAFDNMASRMAVAINTIKHAPLAIIDGRMGAEVLQVYSFLKPTVEEYEQYWYPDKIGEQEPCNSKATPYCSNLAGSIISNLIKRIVRQEPVPTKVLFDFTKLTMMTG